MSVGVRLFFFERSDDFGDVLAFVKETEEQFGLSIELLSGNFKEGLQNYIAKHGV